MVTRLKDPFSGISHGLGVLLAIAGAISLLVMSRGKPVHMIAFGIYGFTLVALYLASSVYHSLKVSPRVDLLLRKFDHVGIFLLIAGTYVPVCLLALSQGLGQVFLVLQGACALVGVLGTFLLRKFPAVLNVVLYLVMGWMCVGALGYISNHWPPYARNWLVAGGLVYTVGAVIYSLDRPHLIPGKFSAHDLWHLFVLGGSACHFMLMMSYVVRL